MIGFPLRRLALGAAALIILCSAAASPCLGRTIQVVTEDWPPFNHEQNGTVVGLSTEVVRHTLDRAGLQGDFSVYPWARAYRTALRNPEVLIYTISKTPDRENLFRWIGPFGNRSIHLYRLKGREDVRIDGTKDLGRYRTGLMRQDATHLFFLEHGFVEGRQIDLAASEEASIRKLYRGRVDMIAGNEPALAHKVGEMGFDFSRLEKVFSLIDGGGYYMAFSRDTSDKLYFRVRRAFEELRSEGKIDRIISRYLGRRQAP